MGAEQLVNRAVERCGVVGLEAGRFVPQAPAPEVAAADVASLAQVL